MSRTNEAEPVILSIGIAQEFSKKASNERDYDQIRAIWQEVQENPEIVGDETDYHNYSVVLSRLDDYLTAYEIVKRGLQQFPYDTDLLADAINYGSKCSKYAEAQGHLATLIGRPFSSWTWRAFQFTIDFFKGAWSWQKDEKTMQEWLNTALRIAERYQKYCPSDERSYLSEYDILQSLAKLAMDEENYDEADRLMNEALRKLADIAKTGKYAAVRCSLRYADEMFQQQNYQEVIVTCDRALQYGQTTTAARLEYLIYLSALSREALLYTMEDWRTNTEEIETIYREYLAALTDIEDDYLRNIRRRVSILAARTGIDPPDALQKKLNSNDGGNIDPDMLRAFLQRVAEAHEN